MDSSPKGPRNIREHPLADGYWLVRCILVHVNNRTGLSVKGATHVAGVGPFGFLWTRPLDWSRCDSTTACSYQWPFAAGCACTYMGRWRTDTTFCLGNTGCLSGRVAKLYRWSLGAGIRKFCSKQIELHSLDTIDGLERVIDDLEQFGCSTNIPTSGRLHVVCIQRFKHIEFKPNFEACR